MLSVDFELKSLSDNLQRIISLILAAVLCLNLLTPAFAEDDSHSDEDGTEISEEDIDFGSSNVYWGDVTGNATKVSQIARKMTLGQSYSVSIRSALAYESAYFTFKPSTTGMYTFSSTGDTTAFLYDYCNPSAPERLGRSKNGTLNCRLTAGETYLYRVRLWDTTGNFSVFVSEQELSGSLQYGANEILIPAGETVYYSYTPETSGTYYIYSTSDDDVSISTYGSLYDSAWNELAADNDGSYISNFKITYTLSAGTQYIVGARFFSNYQSGTVGIVISDSDPGGTQEESRTISGSLQTGTNMIAVTNGLAYYSYTPAESGIYSIYSTKNDDADCYLYDSEWNQLSYACFVWGDRIIYSLSADTEYILGVRLVMDLNGEVSVCLVKNDISDPLKIGYNEVTDNVIYPFVPEKTGTYYFRYRNSYVDAPFLLAENSGAPGSLVQELEAGKTYHLMFPLSPYGLESATFFVGDNSVWYEEYTLTEVTEGVNQVSSTDEGIPAYYAFTPSADGVYLLKTSTGAYVVVGTGINYTYDDEYRTKYLDYTWMQSDETFGGESMCCEFEAGNTYVIRFNDNQDEAFRLTITKQSNDISSEGYSINFEYDGWDASYYGEEIEPWVYVSAGMYDLEQGTDYTVSYSNNTLPGVATITITGMGNYCGTVEKHFTIDKEQTAVGYDWDYWGVDTLETGTENVLYLWEHDGTLSLEVSDPTVIQVTEDNSRLLDWMDYSGAYVVKGLKPGTATITLSISGSELYDYDETTLNIVVTDPGHEHNYVAKETVAPTCTHEGYTEYECTCGHTYRDDYTYALEHNYQPVITSEPTCVEQGWVEYYCTVCGAYGDGNSIPATGEHDYQWVVEWEADCEFGGYKEYRCKGCGDVAETEDIPALGHDYQEVDRQEPDCGTESNGYITYECTRCHGQDWVDLYYEHDLQQKEVGPTCDTYGGTLTYCTKCDYEFLDEDLDQEPLGHQKGEIVSTNVIAPTCAEYGYTEVIYHCDRCGKEFAEYTDWIAPLGHTYGDSEVVREATCVKTGMVKFTCDTCGYESYLSVPALGHSYQFTDNGDGTHTGTCAVCGKTVTAEHLIQNEICSECGYSENVTHTHDFVSTVVAPTCTERGYTEYKCKSCDYSYRDNYTDPVGHKAGEADVVQEATCTQGGILYYYCTECGAFLRAELTDMLPHSWNGGEITTPPECTKEGVKTYTCTACGETLTESVPATGHNWDSGEVTQAATCVEDGVRTYTCTACGETKTESIPATGKHTWDSGEVTKAVTCTEDGVRTYTCTVCGETKTEPIPATGEHTWDAGIVTTAPTYDYDGVRTYTCTVCGETRTEKIDKLVRIDLSKCTVTLSSTTYLYDGTKKNPTVTVKNGTTVLIGGTDYKVDYKNNINAGAATVTITGLGGYTGTVNKEFQINKANQTVKAGISATSLIVGDTATIAAKGTGGITYSSSDTSVATVSSKGVVTAKGLGSATITVKAAGNNNYNAATATIKVTVSYATPVLSGVSNVNGGVKITWSAVTGAANYRVFRKTGSGGWEKVGDTTSTSYTDTTAKSGTGYIYTVRCISKDGKSYTSAYDTAGKSITYIAAPTLNGAANVNGGVKITWSAVTGAANYRVFRKTGSGGWEKVGDTTSTSYTDTTAKSGTGYIYTVRCISKDGKSYTSAYDTSGMTIAYVAVPTLSSVTNSASKKMTVKWAKDSTVTGYQIQYSTSSTFASGNKTITVAGPNNVSKVIDSLTKNNTYYVRIRSYKTLDGKNYYSAWTGQKSVKIST